MLARDIAGSMPTGPASPMSRYLAARTAFFDRVVVRWLDRGGAQVVVVGAGYDGRALRYAKPGVSWYEVDHPATQHDKLARLARLGVATPSVCFVAADFTTDDPGSGLGKAGHDADAPTLFICEGVAVYLEEAVLETLLASLRSVAGAGSQLAISVSVNARSAQTTARRSAFRSAVAAAGEPARSTLTAGTATTLFAIAGWGLSPPAAGHGGQRESNAGFLVLEPA
jgi:methyltransferase (TIGR00027 family)